MQMGARCGRICGEEMGVKYLPAIKMIDRQSPDSRTDQPFTVTVRKSSFHETRVDWGR